MPQQANTTWRDQTDGTVRIFPFAPWPKNEIARGALTLPLGPISYDWYVPTETPTAPEMPTARKWRQWVFRPSPNAVTSRSTVSDAGGFGASFERISAFAELDALRESSFRELIGRIRSSSALQDRDRLADRLEALLDAYKEENEGRALSPDSLRGLENFLEANPTFRRPALTATPAGNLYAQWKSGRDRLLSIHFLPTNDARFVIFKPNPRHTGRVVRISGSTTVDALADAVMPHNVLQWSAA